ncbi:hypothetical protein MED222_06265 [Vibrio sp. MED222]|nr:hypothetical protein MED222_06265 [Vibrio sp. MED222]
MAYRNSQLVLAAGYQYLELPRRLQLARVFCLI